MWTLENKDRGQYMIVRRMEGAVTDLVLVTGQDLLDAQLGKWTDPDYTIEVYLAYQLHETT